MIRSVPPCLFCLLAVGLVVPSSTISSADSDKDRCWNRGRLLRVAAQETETAASLWSRAKAAMDQGGFAEARRLLRQAVQQEPKDGALC